MISETKFNTILKKFNTIDPILVIGDVGIDKYTKGNVKRISPEAPVPIVEVFEEWNKLGLAANVSDNLQQLEVPTTLCGVVGNDSNGNLFENLLEESKLSTWGIVRADNRMTTFKERVVTDVQQVCRVDYESNEDLSDDTIKSITHRISEFINKHSSIILEDYGKGIFCKKFLDKLLVMTKEHNKFIALDPSRLTDPKLYKGVDLLKPNLAESQMMVNSLGYRDSKVEDIANILMDKLDLEKLIITLGSQGMAILDSKSSGKVKTIPTVAREVYDVSGAGDTAISTIVAALTCGATLEEAAWIGNCASGVVVGKKGTALVSQDELKAFYLQLIKDL